MSRNQICLLNLTSPQRSVSSEDASDVCPTRKRLAEAFASLEKIDWQREQTGQLAFAKVLEDRIIWRELLELELQALDEQIERMSEAVRVAS